MNYDEPVQVREHKYPPLCHVDVGTDNVETLRCYKRAVYNWRCLEHVTLEELQKELKLRLALVEKIKHLIVERGRNGGE